MSNAKVWYIAHPVRGDEKFSLKDNLAHTVKVQRILFDYKIKAIAPWYIHILALDDSILEHREYGIEVDHAIIRGFDGIILTGHKLSEGMKAEAEVFKMSKKPVVNLVGVSDEFLGKMFLETYYPFAFQ